MCSAGDTPAAYNSCRSRHIGRRPGNRGAPPVKSINLQEQVVRQCNGQGTSGTGTMGDAWGRHEDGSAGVVSPVKGVGFRCSVRSAFSWGVHPSPPLGMGGGRWSGHKRGPVVCAGKRARAWASGRLDSRGCGRWVRTLDVAWPGRNSVPNLLGGLFTIG